MKLFYKEIVRFIYFYFKKFVIVSYFKVYFGWVKKFKKRKIINFYLIKKLLVCYIVIIVLFFWRLVSMIIMVECCFYIMC